MSSKAPSFDDLGFSPILAQTVPYQQDERRRAIRYVAGGSLDLPGSGAKDADDLADLLDKLGLDPQEGTQ